MGAAVWSAEPARLLDFPARAFVQFFANHGFLQVKDRPQWRVVRGGSHRYVEALVRSYRHRIRLRTPVRAIVRRPDGVRISTRDDDGERFDAVVIATHSDQALALLADPSPAEREILGAIPYQPNEAVLHCDARLLPRRRRAWAAWNAHVLADAPSGAAVTYNMNILQGLDAPEPFCVTLNRTAGIDPQRVIARMTYAHPIFTAAGLAAQRRWAEISGQRRTHYCGAYWGWGFHEDGVNSGLAVARQFGLEADAAVGAARAA
jgi:predicted NAD/FAD-binding protein